MYQRIVQRWLPWMALALTACGADTQGPATLRFQGGGAPISQAFVAVVSTPTQLVRQACPGPPQHQGLAVSCVQAGVEIADPPAALRVVVKARGWRTAERVVEGAALEQARSDAGLAIALGSLPQGEPKSEDYAVVLPTAATMQAFDDLAYHASAELGQMHAVKFLVRGLDGANPEVFFQHTAKHPLHYAFAHQVLGMAGTVSEFEKNTYHGANRLQAAGTLVRYPSIQAAPLTEGGGGTLLQAPVAMTFFPSDDLSPALAARLHRLIEERLGSAQLSGGAHRLVYVPAGATQQAEAQAQASELARADVPWLSHSALYGGLTLQVLNPGIAYGTLRRVTPEELPKTIVAYTDILLLTRLPNELPIAGGTIVEELQTPLAHVNVAAHARGLPNISLLGASTDPRVQPFLGKLVRFEAGAGNFSLREATLQEAKTWWSQEKKPPFVPQHDDAFAGLPGLETLGFGDWTRVGVKAANVAELGKLIKDQAPSGFAVPFSHYQQFVSALVVTPERCQGAASHCKLGDRQANSCDAAFGFCMLPQGATETLQNHLDRLLDNTALQADAPALEAALAGVQWLFEQEPLPAPLATALDAEVAKRFGSAKVRLRSSTNAEDLPGFSGAGLYASMSATADGASAASLRIRSVWASVWSWRAFQERAWWSIDQRHVRMAVLVHQSYPDEKANGVLMTQNIADPTVAGMYVNVQKGEISVTNPEGGAVAEVFSIVPAPKGLQVQRLRWSSLAPGQPLLTDAEVLALYMAAAQVQNHFAPLYKASPEQLTLDLEFKFHGPQRQLIIKQVRPFVGAP